MDFDNRWEALLEPGKATEFFTLAPRPALDPQPGWSLGNAWWLAELSRWIYRNDDRGALLAGAGLLEQQFFSEGATQCALVRPHRGGDVENIEDIGSTGDISDISDTGDTGDSRNAEDFAVLVFRGTSHLRDWITNLRAIPADWPPGGKVHRGFRRALWKVWDQVQACLDDLGDAPILYTGHSLGGALATLAASDRPPTACYTFGAPRVGDRDFGATHTTPLYRVVNHRDVVTTVPPSVDALGFEHGGRLYYIARERQLLVDPDQDHLADLRASRDRNLEDLADHRRWFDPHETLSDHAPINYVAHLERLITA